MESRIVFPNCHAAKKHRPVGVLVVVFFYCFSLLFLNNTGKRKYVLLPQLIAAGYRSNSFVLSVSGHRVKLEDQKMQFSNRLSEIEHYQRSMRIGPVNNNPRPQGMKFKKYFWAILAPTVEHFLNVWWPRKKK